MPALRAEIVVDFKKTANKMFEIMAKLLKCIFMSVTILGVLVGCESLSIWQISRTSEVLSEHSEQKSFGISTKESASISKTPAYSKESASTPKTSEQDNESSSVESVFFRWYHHDSSKNETALAIRVANENRCGLLVFVGKPGCHICDTVWSKSYNGTDMMDGDGKMAAYLKNHKLVGLKIEDSQSHFSDLSAEAMAYRNPDGTVTNANAPFLALVKPKAGECDIFGFSGKKSTTEFFFGGYGSLVMYDKTYDKISRWLDELVGSQRFKDAF